MKGLKMKEVQGVNLGELVSETATQLVADRRKMVGNQIKNLLQRTEGLARKLVLGKREIKKLEDKLASAQAKIDKLKAGDWSVLEERKNTSDSEIPPH